MSAIRRSGPSPGKLVLYSWLLASAVGPLPGFGGEDSAQGLLSVQRHLFDSERLEEERPVRVSLPPGYESNENTRYPVLVAFDAESKLTPLVASIRWLASRGHLPDLIVVGVVNTSRSRDLTPPEISAEGASRADLMVAFLAEELLPWVDHSYRTRPFRVLCGHSLGAMMAVYVLHAAPELFDGYVAISPDLAREDYHMVEVLADSLESLGDRPERLYVAVGDEYPLMVSGVKRLESALLAERSRSLTDSLARGRTLEQARREQAIFWRVEQLPDLDHDSILIPASHRGLLYVFERWRLPPNLDSIEAVETHYRRVSDLVGYEVVLEESTFLGLVAYPLFFDRRYERAVEMFRYAAKRFPASHRPLEGLGDTFLRLGREAEAATALRGALEIATLADGDRERILQKLRRIESERESGTVERP